MLAPIKYVQLALCLLLGARYDARKMQNTSDTNTLVSLYYYILRIDYALS